jgi:hypothetical protein
MSADFGSLLEIGQLPKEPDHHHYLPQQRGLQGLRSVLATT